MEKGGKEGDRRSTGAGRSVGGEPGSVGGPVQDGLWESDLSNEGGMGLFYTSHLFT